MLPTGLEMPHTVGKFCLHRGGSVRNDRQIAVIECHDLADPVEATVLMSSQVGILEDSATHSNAAVASIGDQANYFWPNPLLRKSKGRYVR
jgi:hypothetical protein